MQYLYYKESGEPIIHIVGEEYRYLFKARRHKNGEIITFRNLKNEYIYYYRVENIDKKEAILTLQDKKALIIKAKRELNIAWCIIEPKNIEKILPSLNELGVNSIYFIYCQRSQKNFRIDFKRLDKILLNSSQQSGRSDILKLKTLDSIKEFLEIYPDAKMLNFSDNKISSNSNISSIIIGCEGGFTPREIELFGDNIVGLDTPMILKSESAIFSVASKILL